MLSLLPRDDHDSALQMKRKLSLNEPRFRQRKRQLQVNIRSNPGDHPLAIIARQYQLLESIIGHLQADDLLALALTSKALNKSIFASSTSLQNLLGRLKCSGRGIQIRNECHKKSTFFYSYNCTEYVKCGSDTPLPKFEIKPCITCKVATCNECRIHCTYQSIYEAPSDPDDEEELPNFSGFVLLQPLEQPILSPHHLISETSSAAARWRDPSEGHMTPYHDQGYLDVPLETAASAPSECIEDILDLDLGSQSLVSMSGDSRYAAPSPVLSSLCQVTEARKVDICTSCAEDDMSCDICATKPNTTRALAANEVLEEPRLTPAVTCHCTLRSHILDRWLCLRCYSSEETAVAERAHAMNSDKEGICHCGKLAKHVLCLWCQGIIHEEE